MNTPAQKYPTGAHLRRMAERSAAEDIRRAEADAKMYADFVLFEAREKGYA